MAVSHLIDLSAQPRDWDRSAAKTSFTLLNERMVPLTFSSLLADSQESLSVPFHVPTCGCSLPPHPSLDILLPPSFFLSAAGKSGLNFSANP